MLINAFLSTIAIVVALFMFFRIKRRERNAIIILPIRLSNKILGLLIFAVVIYWYYPFSLYLIPYMVSLYLIFLSANPIFDKSGIYFSHGYTPWENVKGVSEHLGTIVIETNRGWERIGIIKIFFKVTGDDVNRMVQLFDESKGVSET